jgi:DNA-binding NtrC family response regulator
MTVSNAGRSPEGKCSTLNGLRVLLVEDSWHVGIALRNLLQALGADVAGPAATSAEAERLISDPPQDAALVDFNLRGGERPHALVDRLHHLGVRVIIISGYAVVPVAPGKVAAILQKPICQTKLLESLRPAAAQKETVLPLN